MDWIRTHPYPTAIALAVLLILGGAIVVGQHSGVAPQGSLTAWNGGTLAGVPTLDTSGTYVPPLPPAPHISPTDNGGNYKYVSPFATPVQKGVVPTPTQTRAQGDGFTDFETFAASLARSAAADNRASADAAHIAAADVYSFIPSGSFQVGGADEPTRTPAQTALYQYGNDLGNIIKSFENLHQNQVSVFKDFAEDRANATKQAAMKKLAADYTDMGQTIGSIEPPTQAKALHAALMKNYAAVGVAMAAIPSTLRDEDAVAAMEAYDTVADSFVRSLVNVALVFPAYQIQFRNDDGGSVFMMPSGGGL